MKTLIQFLVYSLLCLFIIACERDQDPIDPVDFDPGPLETFFDVEHQVMIFGPAQLYKSDTTSCTLLKSFTIEAYDHLTNDYFVVVRNGNKNGEGRVEDASITINEEVIFGLDDFSKNKGELIKKLTLQKNVELIVEMDDKYSELITVWIVGTHSGPGSAFMPAQAYPGQTGEIVKYEFNGDTITCELINGEIIFQGDIVLTEEQVESFSLKGASHFGLLKYPWPNNTVYYEIDVNAPHKDYIEEAIQEFGEVTNLTFTRRTNEDNYIDFVDGGEAMKSHIGMSGSRQKILVASWATTGKIMHEIGHAVGLIHEHCRSDRRDYVKIYRFNIKAFKGGNFDKVIGSTNTSTFDFGSLMMYEPFAFSWNGKATITKLDGTIYPYQEDELSASDIEILSMIYPVNDQVPVADFSADNTEVEIGEVVQFTDESLYNPTEWYWDFGDGYVNTVLKNPSHAYSTAGIFDVQLIAVNEHGASEPRIKLDYITVKGPPVAEFMVFGPRTITQGESVQFGDKSTGKPKIWSWDFGDGETSNETHPLHQYDTPDTYPVSLTVTNDYGSDTKTEPDYINVGKCMGCETEPVTDVDNNTYNTVRIGNQWWMAENLKVTRYPNGAEITPVSSDGAWSELSINARAYCWYDDDISNKDIHGALYTWSAAVDACPAGWHLPSDSDWKELEMTVGLTQAEADDFSWRGTNEGSMLKADSDLWIFYKNGTNESRFSAIPGGVRYGPGEGSFDRKYDHARFWTSTDNSSDYPVHRILSDQHTEIFRYASGNEKSYGYSVRCVKD